MWWHHVQGLDAFNVLVNYWWSSMPAHIPTPMHALYHAIWTIRDRPEREKQAWREVFDYYVFGAAERAANTCRKRRDVCWARSMRTLRASCARC